MTGFSYPPPLYISNGYNPAFYLSLDQTGHVTYAYAQTLYLGINDYRLSYSTGITAGTSIPGVALLVAPDGSLSRLGALSCSSLTVNGAAVSSAPSYVIGITPGTAALSKSLVLDASGNITGINTLSSANLTGTIQTAAQPNITSLGTLTGLTVSGNISGTLSTSYQPNITSVGALTGLTVSGNISGTLSHLSLILHRLVL